MMKASYISGGCASLSSLDRQLLSLQVSAMASMMRHQPQTTTAALQYSHLLPALHLPSTELSLSLEAPPDCSRSGIQLQPVVSASHSQPSLAPTSEAAFGTSHASLAATARTCASLEGLHGQPPAKRAALENHVKPVTTSTLPRDSTEPSDICKVCCAPAKSGKDYCKSCYGVLYKHIKQIIETIHRDGTKFVTGGTRTETLERLRYAILKTKQRTRRQCEGKCDPVAFRFDTNPRQKCAKCRVLACIRYLPDLALQLLRMHLTRAVALAEQTVNIYSELDETASTNESAASPPELESDASQSSPGIPPPPQDPDSFQVTPNLKYRLEDEMTNATATAQALNGLPNLSDILEQRQLVPQYVNTGSGPIMVLMPMQAPSLEQLIQEQLEVAKKDQPDHFTPEEIDDALSSLKAGMIDAGLPAITLDDDWLMRDAVPLTGAQSPNQSSISMLMEDNRPAVTLMDWQQVGPLVLQSPLPRLSVAS